MNDVLIALWPSLFLLVFGIGELLILFKYKKQQSTGSYIISLIFFILFFLSLFIVILGFGADFPILGIIMYGIPAVIFSFISAFYKNDLEHRFYQKFRTIVLVIFLSILLTIAIIGTVNNLQNGTIGGLSEPEAISKAHEKMVELGQEQNNQQLANAQCRVDGKSNQDSAGNKEVIYNINCEYSARGYYMIEVAKKDGTVHGADNIQY